jgi:hypothetical protein
MKILDIFRRPSERDSFASAVIKRARQRGWSQKAAYNKDDFCLEIGSSGQNLYLENVFKDWVKAEPQERRNEIERVVSFLFERKELGDLNESLPMLLPSIRNRSDLESYWFNPALNAARDFWDGSMRVLCDALAIVVAVDRPASINIVSAKQLREWGVTFEPLLERAISNLRDCSPVVFERDPAGFFVSQYGDQYDCSRLLIPEIFHRLELRGDPVAIPVARNGLVVAGSEERSALLAMAAYAEEIVEKSTRPTAYLPLRLRDGVWCVFDPTDAALEPLRVLRMKQALWDYETQRALLEKHCESIGRDVYVGKVEALTHEGRAYSYTTWVDGLPTLLPRADVVAIHREVGDKFLVRRWEDLWTVCCAQMVDEGFYPSRHFLCEPLTPEQAARLENAFEQPAWMPLRRPD